MRFSRQALFISQIMFRENFFAITILLRQQSIISVLPTYLLVFVPSKEKKRSYT